MSTSPIVTGIDRHARRAAGVVMAQDTPPSVACGRRLEAWYHGQSRPLYATRPSAMMARHAAADHQRGWLSDATDGPGHASSCLFAACWPWGAYARVSSRLRAALGGHDAEHVPDEGCCNLECAAFAACLPFYGCFLARLQSTTRAFYGIGGDDVGDWLDGHCCPCATLARNEQEILAREEQHRRRPAEPVGGGIMVDAYTAWEPMILDDGLASQTPSPQTCCQTPSSRSSTDRWRATAARRGVFPLLRYLGQQWYLVPANERAGGMAGCVGEAVDSRLPGLATIVDSHSLDEHRLLSCAFGNAGDAASQGPRDGEGGPAPLGYAAE
ncbi:hypothetical protein DCS_02017 [Drechmeria coniospora]|uniref:Uncharacterized protein n=1 Tax=Drechmeria coniospora TaxID=98403 RepID=A0A151GUU5_DRECN|nr:hypothetical protein DCS_02017 [Drechmeria coniospora]KYK60879.1 hypothetical protein DCS_02017 [Drechmeria coniospora]ODA83574.1 hypothetical protein RJ55_02088 [Drechmeria coniospora]